MAIINPAKIYPKPEIGQRITIQPIILQQVTKYFNGHRVIVKGWDSPHLELPERQEMYQLYAWNITYSMPAIIDLPKSCIENYNEVSQKAAGGKIIFTRIERQGKPVPYFELFEDVLS